MAITHTITADALHQCMVAVFKAVKIDHAHATDAADVLCYASRRGVDTHGVKNLKGYINAIEKGTIKRKPTFVVERQEPHS